MNLSVDNIIREARKIHGYTQEQMAEKLCIRRSTYAYKEQHKTFDYKELLILSRELNVPIQAVADPSMLDNYTKIREPINTIVTFETKRAEIPYNDPLNGLITHNERLLLKSYRELKNRTSKEKLKEYLEELIKLENEQ